METKIGGFSFVPFRDRSETGRLLAKRLSAHRGRTDTLVLGLPRGGVVVAFEVAKALQAELDIFLAHKLPVPGHEELAMGAVSKEVCILDRKMIRSLGIPEEEVRRTILEQRRQLAQRETLYRRGLPPLQTRRRTVILVDDGIATGSTIQAAVTDLRRQRPKRLIIAVPVAPKSSCRQIRPAVDELVTLIEPSELDGVGRWYLDFSQVEDEEVLRLMETGMHRSDPQE